MDVFNIVAGVITMLSAIFAIYVYIDSKKKQEIEKQKSISLIQFLTAINSSAVAISKTAEMMMVLSDRDETTKKELKHLAVTIVNSSRIIGTSLERIVKNQKVWTYGTSAQYYISKEESASGNEVD